MLSKTELARLSLTDKRDIARALLQSTFNAPRCFPLSYAQEQLWFMDKLQPGSPVYNIPLYIPFQGAFDLAALKKALETLTRRHDMLRARFDTVDDEPAQIVEPDVPLELPVEDMSRLPEAQQRAALAQALNAELQRPFDLSRTCVRYTLFRMSPADHLLSVTMHHIVTDAWSLGRFVAELNAAYAAYTSGQHTAPLPPLQLEYSDYAQWQRATLRGLRLSKLVNYWTSQLAGAPHVLRVPTDHPRPLDQTFNGTIASFMFSDELSEALIAVSRQLKVTPFMLLLACYYALLYRYTGQEDIIVGAPVANRGRPELEPIIGLFINTLILRVKLDDTQTFADLVKNVQRTALDALEHQALPFEKLIAELQVERVPGYPPLYQVVFNFQNASLIESDNPSAEGETLAQGDFPLVHSMTSKVDLNLTITQNGSSVSGGVEYNTDLFDPATIHDMLAHFKMIAETIAADPSIPLMDIRLEAGTDAARAAQTTTPHASAGDTSQLIDGGEFVFDLDA